MNVWVLTTKHNCYDQYGEYFQNVFAYKPGADQLINEGVNPFDVDHVLSGGGWRNEHPHAGEVCWVLTEQELTR